MKNKKRERVSRSITLASGEAESESGNEREDKSSCSGSGFSARKWWMRRRVTEWRSEWEREREMGASFINEKDQGWAQRGQAQDQYHEIESTQVWEKTSLENRVGSGRYDNIHLSIKSNRTRS